jgi:hypothetical protein
MGIIRLLTSSDVYDVQTSVLPARSQPGEQIIRIPDRQMCFMGFSPCLSRLSCSPVDVSNCFDFLQMLIGKQMSSTPCS